MTKLTNRGGPAWGSYPSWDRGMSDAARGLVLTWASTAAAFRALQVQSAALQQARESLQEIRLETSEEGWDGYGALPVDTASLVHAHEFLNALPSSFPIPELSVHPDGEVGLDWFGRAGKVLSISLSSNGMIFYAGRSGGRTFHGSELGFDGIPDTLADAILENAR